MKTSIITITYDKDLEFLKYNLKSIKKFCHEYHENIAVDWSNLDGRNVAKETGINIDLILFAKNSINL